MPNREGPGLREGAIRRQAMTMLRGLEIPGSDDVETLCARLGEHRGRPIVLLPRAFPNTSAFGLWLKTDAADLIVYEENATEAHRQHIIRHEIGHILFDHESDPQSDDGAFHALVPTLPAHVVERALRRSCYDTVAEREAEVFASVVTDLTDRRRGRRQATLPESKLEEAFDDPWSW